MRLCQWRTGKDGAEPMAMSLNETQAVPQTGERN